MEIKKRAPLTRALLRTIAWSAYGWRKLRGQAGQRAPHEGKVSRIGLWVSMELLGGGIVISSIVRTLRNLYPDAKIYIVGEQHRSGTLEGLFKDHSWVDGLIICPDRKKSSLAEWIPFYRTLRSHRLDMAILSPNHSCSDSVWLYMCGIPHIVGCYLPKTWDKLGWIENRFLTASVTTTQIGEGPYRLLEFPQAYARTLTGRDDLVLEELVPWVRFRDEAPQAPASGPRVTIHPGGPPIKRWPVEKYAEIARMLVQHYGASLYIIGGKPEAELADQIARTVQEAVPGASATNCCGGSLNDTMNCIARSALYVGSNTGPYQIAVALGVPVIGVFREQDRWFSGPDAAGERHCVVSRPVLANLSVDEVWSAIERRAPLLQQPAPAVPLATVPTHDLSLQAG